jgi:hypothetical protein
LQFADFGLRPTESLPAVDSFGGRIRFADQILTIREAGAAVGGSPVKLSGRIDLTDWSEPLWRFNLKGLNVRDGFFDSEEAALTSVGVGVRYKTVVGPVRLEYGRNLNPRVSDRESSVHLSIGFPF